MNFYQLLNLAIKEDIPQGDITTSSLGIEIKKGCAHLIAKEDLILSGRDCFQLTVEKIAPQSEIKWYFNDSDLVLNQQTVATISGNLIPVLKAERIALNFLGRLSGIASYTRCFVDKVKHTSCQILDTRKTTPGYRALEKKAVADGGGVNHRMSLSDKILIKENHIYMAGSIEKAIVRAIEKNTGFVEVEVKNLQEVSMAANLNVQRIMLDNMSNKDMAAALEIIPDNIETEASGNMTLDRVQEVAEVGIHFISIGALTHSTPCADFSLLFEWEK